MTCYVKILLPDKTCYGLKRQISNINKELDKVFSGQTKQKGL